MFTFENNRDDQEEFLKNELLDFLESIIDRREPLVSGIDGLEAVKVVEGNGSWTGKVVGVVDHETFSVRRSKSSEPRDVSMFDIRSL